MPLPIRPGLGTESHDITFNADGNRAYSAALSQTVIIDTTDPTATRRSISSFVDPTINVEHQADPITIDDPILGERDFLIIEDEVVGASATAQCPNGGVHVYDITGDLERNPVKVGYWNIGARRPDHSVNGSCTAHVFELHEEEQLMTIAFYNGGVRVVDLSGLVGVALGDDRCRDARGRQLPLRGRRHLGRQGAIGRPRRCLPHLRQRPAPWFRRLPRRPVRGDRRGRCLRDTRTVVLAGRVRRAGRRPAHGSPRPSWTRSAACSLAADPAEGRGRHRPTTGRCRYRPAVASIPISRGVSIPEAELDAARIAVLGPGRPGRQHHRLQGRAALERAASRGR